jgi:excisionase family DNA binding protein
MPAGFVLRHSESAHQELEMADLEDRWLSVDEMAKYLGVSNDTVYRWIDKHAMPAHRMGRLWKFKKDEVDDWVKAGGAADTSDRQGP